MIFIENLRGGAGPATGRRPSSRTAISPSRFRTPPDALTCILGEVWARIRARSCAVAPTVLKWPSGCRTKPKPVEVFTKSAPTRSQISHRRILIASAERKSVSKITLSNAPWLWASTTDLAQFVLHVCPVAAKRLADIDHHVDFRGAVAAGLRGFAALDFGAIAAVRKTDYRTDGHSAAATGRPPPTSPRRA